MHPTLGLLPTHGLFVGLGVLVAAVVFVLEARRRGQTDDRIVYVVLGALVGGAVFMRLGTWLQHVDLRENAWSPPSCAAGAGSWSRGCFWGLTIGSIVGAGVCTTYSLLNMA